MIEKRRQINFILLSFGILNFFVIIIVSVVLYLFFSPYNKNGIGKYDNQGGSFFANQNVDLKPTLTPQELSANYKKDIETQINFVKNTDKDIVALSQELENNLLAIHVPTEEKENFLNVTLQLVRMQKQGLEIDANASKDKILELLNSLLNYEDK
ncbi:MAG: hypothetical protein WC025_00010 [Candidatus Magasanikbacteria bacterium]